MLLAKAESFPKLSSRNSITVDGVVFYIKKVGVIYHCWEYKSRYMIVVGETKDRLTSWLRSNIDKVKERIKNAS
jgi:hypothetical protein